MSDPKLALERKYMSRNYKLQQGFVPIVLVVLIVVATGVGSAGFWVYKQGHTKSSVSNALDASTKLQDTIPADKVGTTEGLTQLSQLEGQSETSIETTHEQDSQALSTQADGTVNDIGGAYDDTSF